MPLIRRPGSVAKGFTPEPGDAFAALEQGTADQRWAAARMLLDLPGGLEALGRALPKERDKRVREVIFTNIAKSDSAESLEMVLPLLRSDDPQLRTGALDALRTMRRAVQSGLPRLLDDADPDVRVLACELARNCPGAEASVLLCRLLGRELEPNVCAAAIEVLAEVGDAEALAALERCADRFRDVPFLLFSIQITAERIRSQSSKSRG